MGLSPKPIKTVNLYRDGALELWKRAESAAREEMGAENVPEGQVLATIAAAYVGTDSPFEGDTDA